MRLLLVPIALFLSLPFAGPLHAADDHDEDEISPAPEPVAVSSTRGLKSHQSKSRHGKSRRKGRKGKMEGHAVSDSQLLPEPLAPPSGNLHLVNIARNEDLKVNILNEDGSYNIDALKAITHLFRCKRTDVERDIEPRLLTILSHIYDHYGAPLELLSGFRNQRKTTSYHYKASASDIRIAGVTPKQLRDFVQTLDAGGMGIGYYPRSQFVHVDVRPPPSYRWIDYSTADPDSADKRPPRNWRTKNPKLRS